MSSWSASFVKDPQKRNTKPRRRQYKNPYLNFMTHFREEMKNKNLEPKQLMKLAGQRWRKMSNDQKTPYIEAALKAKRYKKSKLGKARKIIQKKRIKETALSHHAEKHSPVKSYSEAGSSHSRSETSVDTNNVTSDDNL